MKNAKTIIFGALIAAMILPFSAMDKAEAQSTETKYSKNYIERMFVQLEPLMIKHDNGHLSLNATLAEEYGMSPYDTTFANNWISFNNNLIDVYNSGGDVKEALKPLTHGIFSNVFEQPVFRSSFFSNTACGNYNMANPHEVYREYIQTSLSSTVLEQRLESLGLDEIDDRFGGGIARESPFAPSNCNSGQLRDHVTGIKNGNYVWQPMEPNPNIFDYRAIDIPTYWWFSYVHWWHQAYNNNVSNTEQSNPHPAPVR